MIMTMTALWSYKRKLLSCFSNNVRKLNFFLLLIILEFVEDGEESHETIHCGDMWIYHLMD